MGTSFFTVYKKAVTEFKDPTLKDLLLNQPVLFGQSMYNFLENAISLFTVPLKAHSRISQFNSPYKNTEKFIGDGLTNIYRLVNPPKETIVENCIFEFRVNGTMVLGYYNEDTYSAVLEIAPPQDSIVKIIVYYCGEWSLDLYPDEQYILSQFILSCWAEYISNDKLDIIRLLGDTDFTLTSNASTTTAKTAWNVVNRETATKRMTNFAWSAEMTGLYK